jgi:hypothetical protein
MPLRVIALLLAIAMAAGLASSTVMASPDVAGWVGDDAPDVEPAVAPEPIAIAPPPRTAQRQIVALPAGSPGRLHATSVFRPPRRFASR